MKKPVIVLSGFTPGLGVIRALGSMDIPVVVIYHDKKEVGYASKYVLEKIDAPNPEVYEYEYIGRLLDLGHRFKGCLMIPASDVTLTVVSKHKSILQDSFVVACTDWSIAQKFIEKKYTYEIAKSVGVPAPETICPATLEDVEKYSEIAMYPCLVKPSQSHRYHSQFQKKMTVVNNIDQMIKAYQEAKEKDLEIILQEYIPGGSTMGANYNSYFWDGKPLVEFTAQKLRSAPPTTGSPCALISKVIPEIIEPGRKIINAMGFYGYSCTEFKKDDRDGIYKLMEVNGRHNLSSLLSVECGLNFPWIQYEHLMEGILPSQKVFTTGVYWVDISRDIGYGVLNFRKQHYTLPQFLRPYLGHRVFATFKSTDLKPALLKSGSLFGRVFVEFRKIVSAVFSKKENVQTYEKEWN